MDIFIPQVPVWLLRIGADPAVSAELLDDPMAFAGWYATSHRILPWPAEVQALQTTERAKKLSLERMAKLLSQVNYAFASKASSSQARQLLEGYAVHEWASRNRSAFRELAKGQLETLEPMLKRDLLGDREVFGPAHRLNELCEALGLAPLERDILALSFLLTASQELEALFSQLVRNRWAAEHLWASMFGASKDALARALRATSPLRLSGLLRPGSRKGQVAQVSAYCVQLLIGEGSLFDSLLEPLQERASAGVPARLLEEDLALAAELIRRSKGAVGVNLLLYGAPSLDKQKLLRTLIARGERPAWRVRRSEEAARSDQASLVYLAFALLAKRHPDALLVVDKPSEVLQSAPSEFIRSLFGIEFDPSEERPFDENLLATNAVPGVWLASSISALPEETAARFLFHAPLKKADKQARQEQLAELLVDARVTRQAREDILKLEGVSAVQLASALKAAALANPKTRKERDAVVVQAVRRSQKALARDLQSKFKPSVTQYSLKYLNTAGRFGPEKILECLRRTPKGSMVFYGPPGTGKTQFAEYLAQELGIPLLAKKASDLLSKWVGESEKNIAAAFEEAASEDALLLLDEGDSFLRSRETARERWEVAQVNEMLQAIERFEGIVVVCTNLFRGLDAAALRRFTFKVEFRQLDADQRWEMFQVESGIKGKLGTIDKGLREAWWEQLVLMKQLTAGDFATVKRQALMLNTELTPREWLEQLQLECDVKNGAAEAA